MIPYGGKCYTQETWHLWVIWESGSARDHCVDLSLKLHKPAPSCTTPVWSEPLILHPEFMMSVHEQDCFCWIFKKMSGFRAVSHLTLADKIPTDFQSQIICGLLFPATVPRMVLRPLAFQGGYLQLRYPSGFKTSVHGCKARPFHSSPLSTNLALTSSVYPWL